MTERTRGFYRIYLLAGLAAVMVFVVTLTVSTLMGAEWSRWVTWPLTGWCIVHIMISGAEGGFAKRRMEAAGLDPWTGRPRGP